MAARKQDGIAEKREDGGEICSEDEFRKFTSIHERLKLCGAELLKPIEVRSGKLALLQIALDDELTMFWPAMRKIGKRLDVELPETPELLKEFIHDREIESLYWELAQDGGDWYSIDGRDVHITEVVKMAQKDDEARSKPRYELVEKIDRMIVRLCRRFGIDPYNNQNTDCHKANRASRPGMKAKPRGEPEPAEAERKGTPDGKPVAPAELNDAEQCTIEALSEATLTGERLAKKAGYPYNSNFKSTLSALRKRGILGNKSPGYFLEARYHFLLDKSDQGQD